MTKDDVGGYIISWRRAVVHARNRPRGRDSGKGGREMVGRTTTAANEAPRGYRCDECSDAILLAPVAEALWTSHGAY
jgi:hypothetical protein